MKLNIQSPVPWRELAAASITTPEQLARHIPLNPAALDPVAARYPMRITPYYLQVIQKAGMPLVKQAVPAKEELDDGKLAADPLAEESQSPVPGLTHRYPDRVILLVSSVCAVYCRFCMRKRKVGRPATVNADTIAAGLDYIRRTPAVREVILTGGDPLMRSDHTLAAILEALQAMDHVEVTRIHTRIPAVLPQRITPALSSRLRKYLPLYINTHFNHPAELTPQAVGALARLADAGIPLGSQTVLLRGVNDNPAVMTALFRGLLKARVKPYYLHHPDPVAGTAHFRLPVAQGLAILKTLHGHISGMAIPHYMIDLPGGGGKVPLTPQNIQQSAEGMLTVENYTGSLCPYPEG